jgi:low temperature requirement protein LtrA
MFEQFRQRFWLPPRAHGEAEVGRTVSFLELFYDLVYVVVIARAAHTLAEHLTWDGVLDFAAVFGLIWIAWINGTLYYDLHGRQDMRTRAFVFCQMLLLALMAVFAADAAGDDGAAFAVVFAIYMAVLGWLWYTVRRQDSDEYSTVTFRYLVGMVLSVAIIGATAFMEPDVRMTVWLVFLGAWLVGSIGVALASFGGIEQTFAPSESMIERFGLFIIIVLGEVVVGAVTGMSDAERTALTITTGMLGLMIGFAFWWTYFDFVGRRFPRIERFSTLQWMYSHLPITMAIAAAGAALVSLIEHAHDERTPEATAWVLCGSIAFGLCSIVVTMNSLNDWDRLPSLYRPVAAATVAAAVVVLVLGWLHPAPWLLALLLLTTLSAVWVFATYQWLHLDDPEAALPEA